MGWFDGFPFKSKEQMLREREEFESRIFPLGQAEKEAVALLLAELLSAQPKIQQSEKLFAFVSAKDSFTRAKDPESGMADARYELKKIKWLPEEDREMVLALVRLESAMEALADMPSIEMVRAVAWSE